MTQDTPLRVGDVLYGYCGGEFGRDSYADKRVEVIGADYVVVRTGGRPQFAACDPDGMRQYRTPDDVEDAAAPSRAGDIPARPAAWWPS